MGGATLFPVDRAALGVGETGPVGMQVYGLEDALNAELGVGVRFVLTEGGRLVVLGTVTALLPGPD